MNASTQVISIPTSTNPGERTVYEGGLLADQLGNLKARVKEANDAAAIVKDQIVEMAAVVDGNPVVFEGAKFRAAVTFSARETVDYRAVIDDLIELHGVNAALVAKLLATYTERDEGIATVRLSACKTKN